MLFIFHLVDIFQHTGKLWILKLSLLMRNLMSCVSSQLFIHSTHHIKSKDVRSEVTVLATPGIVKSQMSSNMQEILETSGTWSGFSCLF